MTGTSPTRTPTEELGGIRLMLRDDLAFTLQSYGDQTCYVLEDEAHGSFFRIGVAEYVFVTMLDGRTTVEQALARSAAALGPDAIRDHEAASLCKWLIDNQLAQTNQSGSATRLNETSTAKRAGRWQQYINPMLVVVKLGNPEPWLRAALPYTRWMFRPLGWLVWLIVCLLGLSQVFVHARELTLSAVHVVSPNNWLWLGLAWVGLKLIHESAHALCCLNYGGRSREAGLNWILFVPLPFVDVTSAWRFPSKWQRIYVAAAGIYAELFLAAVAAVVWSRAEIGVLRQFCENIMLTGGVITLLFNANPLMRFDGYYMLADWLELPNLAQHAHQDLMQLGKRWLFGVKTGAPTWRGRTAAIIRTYGILAAVWKLLVTASLILAAEALFHGAGLVLALLATVLWILWPLARFLKYALVGHPVERPRRLRFGLIAILTAAVGSWAWQGLPWSERLVLPAIVDYTPAVTVRSPVGGFVSRVAVSSGALVEEGDELIQLENPEILYSIDELQAAIAKSEIRSQSFRSAEDIAAQQIEDENRRALQQQLREKEREREQLTILAPARGHVIADDLGSLQRSYVAPGESLFLIGDERTKQIQTLVTQADVHELEQRIGEEVEVTLWSDGGRKLSGRIRKVEPRASSELRHPALAATVGGPLPVRTRLHSDDASSDDTNNPWELVEPHFVASVELSTDVSQQLGAGQLGNVRLTTTRYSLGEFLTTRIERWIDKHRPARY